MLQARVVLDPGAPAELLERLRRSLKGAIETTGAVPPQVEIRPVTALEREPGPGQKIMLFKTLRRSAAYDPDAVSTSSDRLT